jgi:hypothetical protein
LSRKSGILPKFIDLECTYGGTLFHPSRPEIERGEMARLHYHPLFRNGSVIHSDSPENKATYPQNAPGFSRHNSGTICGKPRSGETARVANCPIFTKKTS